MDVFTRTFLAGEETAYAPGYDIEDQRTWFAGTIAHDSCHSRLYATGQSYIGRDAELECLLDQLDALKTIDGNGVFVSYVQGLIDGVDEPGTTTGTTPTGTGNRQQGRMAGSLRPSNPATSPVPGG